MFIFFLTPFDSLSCTCIITNTILIDYEAVFIFILTPSERLNKDISTITQLPCHSDSFWPLKVQRHGPFASSEPVHVRSTCLWAGFYNLGVTFLFTQVTANICL